MDAPLVTVIIATYHRPEVLSEAILSVIRQHYTSWHVIVIGDCCTDKTREVVLSFNDDRITLLIFQNVVWNKHTLTR